MRKCEKAVKRYAKENTCLRNLLMSEFEELNSTVGNHSCCLSCHLKCLCSDTKCNIDIPFTQHISQVRGSSKESLKKRKTTLPQRVLLEELLRDRQRELSSRCSVYYLSPEYTNGFSDNLMKSLLSHCKYIFNVDYIQ